MKRILFTLLTLCFLPFQTVAQEESKRVLFIGNSYTEVNNLPNMIQQAAASAGHSMEYAANLPGGCTFRQHCNNESMSLIRRGGWDVVVLQEQSQLPSFPQGQVINEVFPYAQQLVEAVYQYNPCAEPMFYMTWGRRDGDPRNAENFPPLATYEGMDSMLYERYMYMAQANDASVSPVGRVWRYLRTHNRNIELYSGDGSHPSLAGSYAATCAFFALLFEDSPLNITYSGQLDSVVADTIRNVAKRVVYDSLSYWQRPQPIAAFSAEPTTLENDAQDSINHIRFLNTSQNATSYLWNFGDGDTSTVASPIHRYADTGTYQVSLIVTRHCMHDTAIRTILVGSSNNDDGNGDDDNGDDDDDNDDDVNISSIEALHAWSLFPNPASQQATLHTSMAGTAYLYDMQGRLCHTFQLSKGNNTLLFGNLEPQIYILRQGNTSLKVVIR